MRIALVGNQNSGKTTLFNLLTGHNQKIGNWPGVTIEKKVGILRTTTHEIIDLPGVYSLAPISHEEKIVRTFLMEEQVDLIINLVDSTAIERSLYLTTQLLELNIPMVIALNMTDLAVSKGIRINTEKMEEILDTTIVSVSALKKTGIFELITTVNEMKYRKNNYTPFYDQYLEEKIKEIEEPILKQDRRFISIKILEKDDISNNYITDNNQKIVNESIEHYKKDLSIIIADLRYKYIVKLRDEAVSSIDNPKTWTDKLDKVLLNKYFAIPIFVVIMFLVYYLAAGPFGSMTVDFVDSNIGRFGEIVTTWLTNLGASAWSISLVVDGIIAGVGAILNFVPQLIMLFFLIALLETSGYMSRIAFVLDKIFQKVGLSGKSLIPFIIGSGCSVPGIMATRSIQNETEKKMSIILTPFIPCSAKLPIITLFAGYFFGSNSGLVSASLYFLAIVVILVSALIMKKFVFKHETSSFIQELPTYKVPNVRYMIRDTYDKTTAFIKRAGSIILLLSVVIWFLISFSWKFEYGVDVDQSMLASIGRVFSWIFYPMLGELNWQASVSAIQGLIAKEQVVSSMAIIAGFSEEVSDGVLIFNSSAFAFFTASSAYAFMVFNLFSAPCFGAIGAMRREFGSTKLMLKAVLFQTGLALVLATLVFQIGRLIEVIF